MYSIHLIRSFSPYATTPIYTPGTQDTLPLESGRFTLEINEGGSLEFTLPFGHPFFDTLEPMSTFVTVRDDTEEVFYGRIYDRSDPTLTGRITYQGEGALSFLQDSEIPPESKNSKGEYNKRTMTAEAFFRWCIERHNADVNDPRRQFTVGQITATRKNESDEYQITSYTETKSAISQYILDRFGGMLRVRAGSNGVHYIDWVQDYGVTDPQPIEIGSNVTDMTTALSGEGFFTVLRPVGANGLTLSPATIDIFPSDKMAKYGRIIKSKIFNDADTAEKLRQKANLYISRMEKRLSAECQVSLVDFHFLNGSIPKIRLGHMFSNIRGLEGETMTVTGVDQDILKVDNGQYTLKNSKELGTVLDGRVRGGTMSKAGARGAGIGSMALKYYHELEDEAAIEAAKLRVSVEELDVNVSGAASVAADAYALATNNYESISHLENTVEEIRDVDIAGLNTRIRTIEGAAVIQNSDHIANVAGNFEVWENQTTHKKTVHLTNGAEIAVDKVNGGTITVGELTADVGRHEENINSQRQIINNMTGSALWTQRDQITGVSGQFEVVEIPDPDRPGEFIKKLKIVSGGGMVVARDGAEYGLYDEDNLTGGILTEKLQNGKILTDIRGDNVKITAQDDVEISVSTAIASQQLSINGLQEWIATFEGSDLYVGRDHITGVVGEYDVITNQDGTKTLVIKSGGGIKIRRNNTEFGIYDEGNLNAGIIADKINNETNTYITGDHIKIGERKDGSVSKTIRLVAGNSAEIGLAKLDANGNVVIGSDGRTMLDAGTKITRTKGGVVTSYGIYDEGNLTGGTIVEKLNDGSTTTKIKGTRVIMGEELSDGDLKTWAANAKNGTGVFAKYLTVRKLEAQEIRTMLADIDLGFIDSLEVGGINATGEVHGATFTGGNITITGDIDTEGGIYSSGSVETSEGFYVDVDGQSKLMNVQNARLSQDGKTLYIDLIQGGTLSFKKAASSLSGAWSGSTLTVTPTGDTMPTYKIGFTGDPNELLGIKYKSVEVGSTAGTVTVSGAVTSDYYDDEADIWVHGTERHAFNMNVNLSGLLESRAVTINTYGKGVAVGTYTPIAGKIGINSFEITINPEASWNAGWNAAAGKVITPTTQPSNITNTLTITYPNKTTPDGADGTIPYTVTVDDDYAYIKAPGGVTVARVENLTDETGWNAGYDTAEGYFAPPETKTAQNVSNSFTIGYPKEDRSGQGTYTYTMTKGTPGTSGYASVMLDGNLKARIDISDWYIAGQNSVSVNKSAWSGGIATFSPSAGTGSGQEVRLVNGSPAWSGNTATVEIWDGQSADVQHGSNTGKVVTVDASDKLESRAVTINTVGKSVSVGTYTPTAGKIGISSFEVTVNPEPSWNAGYDTAEGYFDPPATKTASNVSDSFTIGYPKEDRSGQGTYTYTMTKGTPGTSGYASVVLNGNLIARIDISDWYTSGLSAGVTAGQNGVTVTKGSWSGGLVEFNKSAGTASRQEVRLALSGVSWNGNTATVQIWDGTSADAQHGSYTGKSVTVDASGQYNAGYDAGNSAGYSSGYSAGNSAGITTGQNGVTINKGAWSGGQISFTKSAGTASTKSVQLVNSSPTWNGNTATVQIWDGQSADAQHGSYTGKDVTVDASGRYNAGYDAGGATAHIRYVSSKNSHQGTLSVGGYIETYHTKSDGTQPGLHTWWVPEPWFYYRSDKGSNFQGMLDRGAGPYIGIKLHDGPSQPQSSFFRDATWEIPESGSTTHSPKIDDVWTSSSWVSGATEYSKLAKQYKKAKNDGDNLVFRVKCGTSTKTYIVDANDL